MFDKLIIKAIVMFGILVFVILGCSNMLHTASLPTHTMAKTKFPSTNIYIHDTVLVKPKLYTDDKVFRDRVEALMYKTSSDVSDLKNLNVQWQKTSILLMERTSIYREQRDSIASRNKKANEVLDSVIKISNKIYKENHINQQAAEQTKVYNSSFNYQNYIAFSIIVLLLLANAYLSNMIRKEQQKKLNYVD